MMILTDGAQTCARDKSCSQDSCYPDWVGDDLGSDLTASQDVNAHCGSDLADNAEGEAIWQAGLIKAKVKAQHLSIDEFATWLHTGAAAAGMM